MSIQTPFYLTKVNDAGVEVPYTEEYYYTESELHLTLRGMFLGTTKSTKFRLYNNMSPDEDAYSTFSLLFDLSEAFTFGDGVRYDTTFHNSLRKFIKISVQVGSVESDVTTQAAHEVSSPYHVAIDTPIYGVIFFRNQDEYNAAVSNGALHLKYLLIPYFPNPGEYISFTISIKIPSEQEENFLEKALGFPIKQAEYKSPVTAAELSKSVIDLQRQYITGGSADHQILISYVGPIDTSLLIGGAARYPYMHGMLGRLANRGYIFSQNGVDIFSNVRQPIIFSVYPLSHGFFSNSTVQNYYKGLPSEISTVGGSLSLLPDTSDRTSDMFIFELTTTLAEITTYLGQIGEQDSIEHNAYVTKLYDILSNLFTNYINNNGLENWVYNPETHNAFSPLDSFNAALTNIWASAYSNFLVALQQAFPTIFNTTAPLVPKYDYISQIDCILDYFDVAEDLCDFSYLHTKSIWEKTPSQIVADNQSVRLLHAVLMSLSILKSTKTILLAAPGLTAGQKTTLAAELNYFDELILGISTFISKHVLPDAQLLDETKESGSGTDLLADLDSVIFPFFVITAGADYLLGLNTTISRQFWHYVQKLYYYRGVFTDIAPMLLTHTKPVADIRENATAVLNDFDGEKSYSIWFLSNIAEKEADKLISLKVRIAAII